MLDNAVQESREALSIAKFTRMDCIKHIGKVWVEVVLRVNVRMAEVFDVFRKVTEKEYVLFANLARYFNLPSC